MLDHFEISSEWLTQPRKLWVQPAEIEEASDCLIFLDAEFYIENMEAPAIVANLQKSGVLPPLTSIYLSHLDIMARDADLIEPERTCSDISGVTALDSIFRRLGPIAFGLVR